MGRLIRIAAELYRTGNPNAAALAHEILSMVPHGKMGDVKTVLEQLWEEGREIGLEGEDAESNYEGITSKALPGALKALMDSVGDIREGIMREKPEKIGLEIKDLGEATAEIIFLAGQAYGLQEYLDS